MELKDLAVESASVRVGNVNQVEAKYTISAVFNTKKGELTRIDSGFVYKDGRMMADFSKDVQDGNSYRIGYTGLAFNDLEMQCEINQYIHDFIGLAEAKAMQEVAE